MAEDVVIVGGGVGGLAVAWNLWTEAKANGLQPMNVVIVEASDRWGGNADTVNFTFGSGPGGQTVNRWADLGVNDFNATAYTEIVKVMDTIGFVDGKDYLPLEDSTSYYTGDGSLYFTDNGNPWWGTRIDPTLGKSVNDFMVTAGKDATDPNSPYAAYTIEAYITEKGKARNWDPRLGPQVIYPRINGMYFVSELGPRAMPFMAVMHYYAIQEGAGGKKAERRYFVGGASRWIDALVGYMQANMPTIRFQSGFRAEINRAGPQANFVVTDASATPKPPIEAARIVLAAHADDCLTAFRTGLPAGASATLASVRYNNGVSVAHTDSRLLPVDSNAWCTYNILIHQPGSAALKPYVINYVANRHQNDAANPEYDRFGLPVFFVSVNPQQPIPESMILKDASGQPAVANLRHNTLDFDTMDAQLRIATLQGAERVYYAGGWTHGAGLHEECWVQGEEVAQHILASLGGPCASLRPKVRPAHAFIQGRLARNAAAG